MQTPLARGAHVLRQPILSSNAEVVFIVSPVMHAVHSISLEIQKLAVSFSTVGKDTTQDTCVLLAAPSQCWGHRPGPWTATALAAAATNTQTSCKADHELAMINLSATKLNSNKYCRHNDTRNGNINDYQQLRSKALHNLMSGWQWMARSLTQQPQGQAVYPALPASTYCTGRLPLQVPCWLQGTNCSSWL